MCGIAGIHRRGDKPMPKLNQLSDELLLAIENRGRHAAGYLAMMDDGKVQMQKLAIPASRFVHERGKIRGSARNVLLHTRWATVGSKEDPRNAHPVAAGTIAAIHNGTIYNASALFAQYKLPRVAQVDSEIFPALINHLGWANVEKALAKMDGGAAVAIVNTETPDEVILARLEHYPLVYAITKHAVIWASTEKAIQTAWYLTYGRDLPVRCHHMREGRIARVNGSVEISTLPRSRPKTVRKPKGTGRPALPPRGVASKDWEQHLKRSKNRTSIPAGASKGKTKKRARIKHAGIPVTQDQLPTFAAPRVSYGLGYATFDPGYYDEVEPAGNADDFYDALRQDGFSPEAADEYAYGTGRLPGWVAEVYTEFLPS